ncbi:HAD-IA family hydrolase [Streptomyces longisporoflavus]|uniref:HAD-IA family hydrolase n=1 Tax=Streptomyces longisporoflavus TaxID=28044 RepID=A0ABW7QZB5_9ACTN
MRSPLPRRAHQALVRWLAGSYRERPDGQVANGHHNVNYVVPLRWTLALLLRMPFRAQVKCRTPLAGVQVVPRIWHSEAQLLSVVTRHLREVPRCVADFGDWSLHAYRAGRALSEMNPDGPVDEDLMWSFAEFFARAASVPEKELPPRPEGWPEPGDSQGFLDWLIDFTEDRVHRPNRGRFDALFEAVGIRTDVMTEFKRDPFRSPLTSRPFCLLHTDVHRANVIVDGGELVVIDWELALYGDPLHDLATHLVRMGYDKDEQKRMTRLWAEAMVRAGHEDMTAGLDDDLGVYLDFEYAQSVFPDVMRAALALRTDADEDDFGAAAVKVCGALRRAADPLKLTDVPDERRAERALRDWHAGLRWRPGSAAAGITDERGIVEDAYVHGLTSTDEFKELADWLTPVADRCVLFDFDGPICRLFPHGSSEIVARDLRGVVSRHGLGDRLTVEVQRTIDPHDVLRAMDQDPFGRSLVPELEDRLTKGEVAAADTAPATPGSTRLIRALKARGCRIAVVTNNSPQAVAAYLKRESLLDAFGPHIYGRTDRPSLLKPHPDSLDRALDALGAEPEDALMIGDTATDLEAAAKANVRFVGYGRDERKAAPLRAAGAEIVVTTLHPLVDLVESCPS